MALSKKLREYLSKIAEDSVSTLGRIAEGARRALSQSLPPSAESFATMDQVTLARAMRNLSQIHDEQFIALRGLVVEPAIARIVVKDSGGRMATHYISRGASHGFEGLASYYSPIGRLASREIGDTVELPRGAGELELQETAKLRPLLVDEGWDSRDTVVEGWEYGPLTIESLRALVQRVERVDQELLDKLLAEEEDADAIFEGIRRRAIEQMALRDQPILDKYQDDVFRLPLERRLMLLGPPGTGKTTTLIRRLGQKLRVEFLEPEERRLVDTLASTHPSPHAQSWLMFSPTELLRQYVKEAFNREGIPASDQRIMTWDDFRRDVARNDLRLLRTASGSGFILKDQLGNLKDDAIAKSADWFKDFYEWQQTAFMEDLRQTAIQLSGDKDTSASHLGKRLLDVVQPAGISVPTVLAGVLGESKAVLDAINGWKGFTDKQIRDSLNTQVNRDKDFLDTFGKFLEGLGDQAAVEDDDPDDPETDEDEEPAPTRIGRAAAMAAYMKAARVQARAHLRGRPINKQSRNGRAVEWLGSRLLPTAELPRVGASLLIQSRARKFANPVGRLVQGFSTRYRAFRRARAEDGKWYRKGAFAQSEIHPLELDLVLLAALRSAGELLTPQRMRDINSPAWASLRVIGDLYRNQVVVDEVSDFSPVQIGCMASLAHPQLRSFFASGDFNQRLTRWGARSEEDLKWLLPDLSVVTVNVSYRHTRNLHEFADAIIRITDNRERGVHLPANLQNEGVRPALAEGKKSTRDACSWVAARILDIERFADSLPSLAVFVHGEELVQPVAETLNALLLESNIRVVACLEGRAIGQENDVRVFDIQHIKGLEFEGAFILALDHLAMEEPDLFDKYLYVGVTRAATYLGITCQKALPKELEGLREHFVGDWRK